jgi:hypothetical protein
MRPDDSNTTINFVLFCLSPPFIHARVKQSIYVPVFVLRAPLGDSYPTTLPVLAMSKSLEDNGEAMPLLGTKSDNFLTFAEDAPTPTTRRAAKRAGLSLVAAVFAFAALRSRAGGVGVPTALYGKSGLFPSVNVPSPESTALPTPFKAAPNKANEAAIAWTTAKRMESWKTYGEPPKLQGVASSDWKSCFDYTNEERAKITEYADYWANRVQSDTALQTSLNAADLQTNFSASTTKSMSYDEGKCEHYSIGLSGPFNGLKPSSDEFKAMKCEPPPLSLSLPLYFRRAAGARSPSTFSPNPNLNPNPFRMPRWVGVARPRAKAMGPKAPVAGKELDVSGECSFESYTYWACDLGFYYSVTALSTSYFTLSMVAKANFDFVMDLDNCDIGLDIGGSLYLYLEIDTVRFPVKNDEGKAMRLKENPALLNTFLSSFFFLFSLQSLYSSAWSINVWEGPSVSASPPSISISVKYSVFTLEVGFSNAEGGCSFNYWTMTVTPGFETKIYSDSTDIEIGTISLGLSD